MAKKEIEALLSNTLTVLQQAGQLPAVDVSIQVDPTKDSQHGDFASNIALLLAKPAQKSPRAVAEIIVAAIPSSSFVREIKIAGPGFINFYLEPNALWQVIPAILQAGERYGQSHVGEGQRVILEYVSANPTGPLHVGHGRHAAYGAVVANLLETVGFSVHREYYVNDAGRQMDILAVSTWLRYLALCGQTPPFPSNAYRGEYVIEIAEALHKQYGQQFVKTNEQIFNNLPADEPQGGDKEIYIDAVVARTKELLGSANYQIVFDVTLDAMLADIRSDLAEFGVTYDEWFSERHFVQGDAVERNMQVLAEQNLLYTAEGATWFKSSEFGDEKDRVLQRSNGQRTYFANDFAYHINKFERGFDHAIDIFGADHHGYIPRMRAGLKARGIASDKLTYLLVQFVTLYRHGEQVQMSTRSGSFVTLRELRDEVGNDAARFFYVMRKCEQHVDFDLDLAKSQSNENPVYYIQYAHTRICGVFRQLDEKKLVFDKAAGLRHLSLLNVPQEIQLLNTLNRYQDQVEKAALQYEPHLLTNYLRSLAQDFHTYYNSEQFLVADEALRNARLTLALATRQVLVNGLTLLGVSAPMSM